MNLRTSCALGLLGALSAASAQTPPEAFLARSLAAYGPTERIQTVAYTAEGSAFNRWQARDPRQPDALPTKADAILRLAPRDFRIETEQRFPGGYLFHFVTVAEGPEAHTYDVPGSRVGKALFLLEDADRAGEFTQGTDRLPFWIVRTLLTRCHQSPSTFSLQRSPEGDVQITESGATPVRYLFEARTLRLHRLETARPTALGETAQTATDFEQERIFDGLWQPTRIRTTLRGKIAQAGSTESITAFRVNAEPPGVSWRIPSDRQAAAPGTALQVERVSEHLVNLIDPSTGRNLPFWRSGDEITAFDAPLAPAFCDRALAEVHKVWPSARLTRVVISHFHADHVAGLARYVREGARVLCAAPTRPMLEELLAFQNVPFSDATFSPAPPAGLDLYEVPNAHVMGMLLAHLPQEGLIYQGDLVSLPEDGTLTPPLAVTRDLFAFLRTHPLTYTRMIAHHGNSRITPALMHTLEGFRP